MELRSPVSTHTSLDVIVDYDYSDDWVVPPSPPSIGLAKSEVEARTDEELSPRWSAEDAERILVEDIADPAFREAVRHRLDLFEDASTQ